MDYASINDRLFFLAPSMEKAWEVNYRLINRELALLWEAVSLDACKCWYGADFNAQGPALLNALSDVLAKHLTCGNTDKNEIRLFLSSQEPPQTALQRVALAYMLSDIDLCGYPDFSAIAEALHRYPGLETQKRFFIRVIDRLCNGLHKDR